MVSRKLSIIAGVSYVVIFFTAVFANFFVLEGIIQDPLTMIEENHILVRFGIMAFLVTAVCDVIVAWAVYELYKEHILTTLSTYFRLTHAVVMCIAVFVLPGALELTSGTEILRQVDIFNTIWLIGLFFFGFHLILLGKIFTGSKIISFFLIIAGVMYIFDTSAHFLFPFYDLYADIFLALVAIPSIFGEMSFAIWLLAKEGKRK